MSKLVLITRPLEDAKEIEADIVNMGYEVFLEPLLNIKHNHVEINDLSPYSGLIFTSRNAVRVFGCLSAERAKTIYVVGENTRKLAKNIGFSDVIMAGETVRELIMSLPEGQYWHGRGEDITLSLIDAFADNHNVSINDQILYYAKKAEKFSQKCLDHLENQSFSDILFFSTRTAEAFVELYKEYIHEKHGYDGLKHTKALCLSASMIKCFSEIKWQEIAVAEMPNRQSLLALI